MNSYISCVSIAIIILAIVENGAALQCWECGSDQHGRCADYFNTTLFPRTSLVYNAVSGAPRIVTCENAPAPYTGGFQRYACLKKVITDRRFQRTTYTRQCQLLIGSQTIGRCPTETTSNDISIDHCELCDTHECNGAQILQKGAIWLALLPLIVALIMHK